MGDVCAGVWTFDQLQLQGGVLVPLAEMCPGLQLGVVGDKSSCCPPLMGLTGDTLGWDPTTPPPDIQPSTLGGADIGSEVQLKSAAAVSSSRLGMGGVERL